MTTSIYAKPFLFRYAELLSGSCGVSHRYDELRQVSQVRIGDAWIDAADSRVAVGQQTRMTKVAQETTDDG
jgi:hypothetical protein